MATGKRLWFLVPPEEGDFNVPTPIDVGGRLLVTTENNGTRLYEFDDQGQIRPEPAGLNMDLAPDSMTPVVIGGKVYGVWGELFCLDLEAGLKLRWTAQDVAYEDYASIIGNPQRMLITSTKGELLLVRADGPQYELISRLPLFDEEAEVLSHPAMVEKRLYVRDHKRLRCIDLGAE